MVELEAAKEETYQRLLRQSKKKIVLGEREPSPSVPLTKTVASGYKLEDSDVVLEIDCLKRCEHVLFDCGPNKVTIHSIGEGAFSIPAPTSRLPMVIKQRAQKLVKHTYLTESRVTWEELQTCVGYDNMDLNKEKTPRGG